MDFGKVLQTLADAPVANLMVILGAALLLLAAAGKAPRIGTFDGAGRALVAVGGLGLLVAGWQIASKMTSGQTSASVTSGAGTRGVSRDAAIEPPVRHLRGDVVSVEWGCGETKTATASVVVPEGAEFVSAELDIPEIDKARAYEVARPLFDPATCTVRAEAVFHGLERVFFNCAGGGHARMQLQVEVR